MSVITTSLKHKIKDTLSLKIGKKISIQKISSVNGGCINNTSKIDTNHGTFFLKWNLNCDKKMFSIEKKGLKLLDNCKSIYIPKVISESSDYLLMEYIKSNNYTNKLWEKFGRSIADLHQLSNEYFGLEYYNYIGPLIQQNDQKDKWIDFFINKRIIPQLKISNFNTETLRKFDKLFINIETIFHEESPSLLHGDLWNGNFLFNKEKIVLFDPAVYFGNREMDIAMTKLFGGFDNRFYHSYNEVFPFKKGWEERIDICNLYPLLVHVNLFGVSYYSQLMHIVKRFI
tara:strand:+ start:9036 stop:9893 length:858 start_codon:yes stop_codon:yes gene_type:complete